MKKSLLFYFLLFVTVSLFAKTRDVGDAQVAGARFVSLTHGGANKSATVLPTLNLVYTANSISDKPSFYVFNNDGGGYVIVSADDRAVEILAYSNDGRFDKNSIPENLRWWLNFYSDEIAYLQTLPEGDTPNKVLPAPSVATAVAPLLGNRKWDQGDPYNMFCPTLPNGKKAAVGCTATAMAQIMGYHKWPVQGKGSKQYETKTHKFALSVDFSETYYDWANMTPTYGTTSTQAQKRAVATLSYHCGVGASMNYDSESGASTVEASKAFVNYFGYDKDLNEINRNNYGREEWAAIIRKELDAARPVLYSGFTSDAGHAFVCDGYDDKGFFHINWGWSGLSDGYYQLTALAPGSQGTGGSAGGFNRN